MQKKKVEQQQSVSDWGWSRSRQSALGIKAAIKKAANGHHCVNLQPWLYGPALQGYSVYLSGVYKSRLEFRNKLTQGLSEFV